MITIQEYHNKLAKEYPDTALLIRDQDNYTVSGDDALLLAEEFGLTLYGQEQGEPYCGFPFHDRYKYISYLVTRGFKVAVLWQKEQNGCINLERLHTSDYIEQ